MFDIRNTLVARATSSMLAIISIIVYQLQLTHCQAQSVSFNQQPQQQLATEPNLRLTNSEEFNALGYLQKYGYINAHSSSETNNLIAEESFSDAIRGFQRFAGLNQTGSIDKDTLTLMQLPRCGNSDRQLQVAPSISKQGKLKASRYKRYALQGSKWRRQELTYRISQYPTRFSGKKQDVDAQIEKAFGIWSQVAPIDFIVKRDGKVHIDIRFASGEHGDGDAFDGPGNTLAHAYFPQYGGDAHFDDQEYWTIDSFTGTNIFQVAAHELGHSLGLGHSNVREALMAPFYQKYKPNFKLHLDDILAIQALYGEKSFLPESVVPQSPPTSSSSSSSSSITSTSTSTTSTTTEQAFVPDLTGLSGNGISVNGFGDEPAGGFQGSSFNPARPTWPLPLPQPSSHADLCSDSAIDAVTRTEDGSSYVFKGDHYWLLSNEGITKGYPRRISADWDGLTGPIDAALTWADGKTFFFKGNKYWRYRNKQRDIGYPKLISLGFSGIPDDVDAAFVWSGNGRTYFFKGSQYWRFDSKADPPVSNEYPRSIKVWNGVPFYIDAAFKWDNNVTYFFKGNQYYRFNDKEFKVEPRGRPPFPRSTAEWWFGCVGSNLAQRALPHMPNTIMQELSQSPIYIREQELIPKPTLAADSSREWSLLSPNLNNNITVNNTLGTHVNDRSPTISDNLIPNEQPAWAIASSRDQLSPRIESTGFSIFGRGANRPFVSSAAISNLCTIHAKYLFFVLEIVNLYTIFKLNYVL